MCLREEPAAGQLPVDDATASATGGLGATVGVSTTDRPGFTSLGCPRHSLILGTGRRCRVGGGRACLPSRQKREPTV